ncbi:MAG TPA: DUF362 domain-containing protein [Bryobacteraceae bacterium]|nr:DUF362 domain-containing protein [Bryobacteraceae bacterium]
MRRRDFLGALGATAVAMAAPASAVAIAKVESYQEDIAARLSSMFDQLGGLGPLVSGKTVTVKLNLTGSPGLRFQGRPLGVTHYTHPRVAMGLAAALSRAGARRIRFVESCWASGGPMEEYLLDSGWNVRQFLATAPGIEFENTNNLGKARRYARLKVPGKPYLYPAYDLNHSYEDTDVFVSLAKLKNHETCGITLTLKNIFGITPASIYGDDAGLDEPNEKPLKGRGETLHFAKRAISKSAPQETSARPSRDPGTRVPLITAELAAARPIHLAIIDGIESIAGGEGPWVKGLRLVKPGLLIAGLNPVSTDAVGAAIMGYDPRAARGRAPFQECENTLLAAEALAAGAADIKRIDIRGISLDAARYPFG